MKTRLGAYRVKTRTKLFPRDFWVVYETPDRIFLEVSENTGMTVSCEDLDEAIEEGDVVRVEEWDGV